MILNSMIDGWGISCEIALQWISLDLIDMQFLVAQGKGSMLLLRPDVFLGFDDVKEKH